MAVTRQQQRTRLQATCADRAVSTQIFSFAPSFHLASFTRLSDTVLSGSCSGGVSARLRAFGTAAAVIPDFVPVKYKVPIAVSSWLAGIVGFSINEALGGQAPKA